MKAKLVKFYERRERYTPNNVGNDIAPANDSGTVNHFNAHDHHKLHEATQGCSLPAMEPVRVVDSKLHHVETGYDVRDHKGMQANTHEVNGDQLRKASIVPL